MIFWASKIKIGVIYLSKQNFISMGSINVWWIKESDSLTESILYDCNSILLRERRIVDSCQAHTSKPQLWDLRKQNQQLQRTEQQKDNAIIIIQISLNSCFFISIKTCFQQQFLTMPMLIECLLLNYTSFFEVDPIKKHLQNRSHELLVLWL